MGIWIFLIVGSYFLWLFSKEASAAVIGISYILMLCFLQKYGSFSTFALFLLWMVLLPIGLVAIPVLRRNTVSRFLFALAQKKTPRISSTEKMALEVGTAGFEAELFCGKPGFSQWLASRPWTLSEEEQAFIQGPLQEICRKINDWEITHILTDIPETLWQSMKQHKLFGMIIPKEYGGLGFSASAQAQILAKLYSCSITVATTVSVPNSLGPAELLLKYGTKAQKEYYLPRLADGREIPCFALTAPDAGSDAASILDKGIVCYQAVEGKQVLGVKLSWNKRYITLCPVATLLGLAFRLFDPDLHLGKGVDVGISIALIPADTEGVIKGRRHFPLNTGFLNGPTQGKDVFVSLDCLIGGVSMAGQGWAMLMECLSVGRAISLPSSALGGAQTAALVSGAYARVRRQFFQPIASFEGIEEPLARIAGNTYIIHAGVMVTCAAIDRGEKPSLLGAILKYQTTERSRKIVLDAMDIHGGKAICLGPKNYLARAYQGAPIAITVEGANILTRSLIIFGQGAMRCHPYLLSLITSMTKQDSRTFDQALFGYASFFVANSIWSLFLTLTHGRMVKVEQPSAVKRYYQWLQKDSSKFAFLMDVCLLTMGMSLKRKEKISARLGDILGNLYLFACVLKFFHDAGEPEEDLPLVEWSCQQLLYECELAFHGVISNFPSKTLRVFLRLLLQPLGVNRKPPCDTLGRKLAKILTTPNSSRDRLTAFVYKEQDSSLPVAELELAFQQICAAQHLEKELWKKGKKDPEHLNFIDYIRKARQEGEITEEEAHILLQSEKARQAVVAVDDFDDGELRRG